ncbi:MAG TPA: YigZ family protein [Edaphocola sp.]|nr:YigZ family protein [Edaphocola sp.]
MKKKSKVNSGEFPEVILSFLAACLTFAQMSAGILSFQTIISKGNSIFRDRGSKFLGFCFPVNDREEIRNALKHLKELHSKANHHCYAWRLGVEGTEYRASDNGEPSGSAGKPILGQIDSAGLTNVLVVVVRYFGGTLLGIPGLINAYKAAAGECLAVADKVEKEIRTRFQLSFDYTLLNDVMGHIRRLEAKIIKQDMALFCTYDIEVPLKNKMDFLSVANNLYGLAFKAV